MKRHALPATLTSTGRVVQSLTPGPAESLTGAARWREVYRRLRKSYGAWDATRLTVAAWRHGVVLSGSAPGAVEGGER